MKKLKKYNNSSKGIKPYYELSKVIFSSRVVNELLPIKKEASSFQDGGFTVDDSKIFTK